MAATIRFCYLEGDSLGDLDTFHQFDDHFV